VVVVPLQVNPVPLVVERVENEDTHPPLFFTSVPEAQGELNVTGSMPAEIFIAPQRARPLAVGVIDPLVNVVDPGAVQFIDPSKVDAPETT
jgi:hypothetical protein